MTIDHSGCRKGKAIIGKSNKARRGKCGGGLARRKEFDTIVDAVGALSALWFERLDSIFSLLHRAGHEPANGVLLSAVLAAHLPWCALVALPFIALRSAFGSPGSAAFGNCGFAQVLDGLPDPGGAGNLQN